jgi:hypothetical protein
MNETTPKIDKEKRNRWFWLVVTILCFAGLMGVRDALDSTWNRAVLAGLAGIFLAIGIQQVNRKKT